ncbi:kinase-like domain-containing protein [Rhizophagus clarus]|uniref:Kinase-like domain-containing protein n=1 Tax=Rhizophagus clarus TaxID=94130 RepID=A0A8H3QH86_9GLOM|nr:kinase-like domain-containing protein [Rhizophagus clarus]
MIYLNLDFGTSGNEVLDQFISKNNLNWIPFNAFKNIEYLDKREFGATYKAIYKDIRMVLKYFNYLNNPDENLSGFLNKFKIIKSNEIINLYGITKNPDTLDYMLVVEYANEGNLRGCLTEIIYNWNQKLYMLFEIIIGLNNIHKEGLIHYNFHDGNILCVRQISTYKAYISDYLESYRSVKSFLKKGNNCGVIPFMAPEVLRDLMKRCWDNDPLKRPSASEVLDIIKKWVIPPNSMKIKDIDKKLKNNIMEFINAPTGYNNIITESHPQACYTSRLLDFTGEVLCEILEGSLELKFFELKQRNKDVETRSSQFEQDNQYLRLELAKQIKEFAEKENTLQAKITYLQNEIYEKQVSTGNLTESLKQNKLTSQQIQINQLKQEKSNLQEKLAQTEVNIEKLKTQQESLINQKAQLEIELNQFKTNCEQIEQEKVELQNIIGGLIHDQRFTAKLKIKCVKLEKEIAQLVQRLNNEEQIRVQLSWAIQIKEDKINKLEQKLINFDSQKELNEFEKKSENELTNEENTTNIYKEREVMIYLQQESSKTSIFYSANRKEQDLNMSNLDKVIEELKKRFNHLENSLTINSEKGHLNFSMMAEEINLLRKNLDRLELKLNQEENKLKNLATD